MVDGITSLLNSSISSSTNTSKGNSELGKDDFLKLMIAQLQNQDPMEPLDSSAYSAQLAQFSSLEQLSNINDSLETSINANYILTQSINNTMSAGWIGKEVKISGNTLTNNSQGNISIGYTLPSEAASVTVKIYDSKGALVKTINSEELAEGNHKLSWDFTDNNGYNVAKGDYTFKIEAKNSAGKDITVDSYRIGEISSVRYTDNGTVLVVGNVEYNLSDITEILNTTEG